MDLELNGYDRYKKYADQIVSLTNDTNKVGNVIDEDNNRRMHYVLENGLHVYVAESGTVLISKKEIDSLDRETAGQENEDSYDVYMKVTDRSCKFCVESEMCLRDVGIEYYSKKEYGTDKYYLPIDIHGDFSMKSSRNRTRQNYREGDISNYTVSIFEREIGSIRDDSLTRNAYRELEELCKTVHIVAEKGYKDVVDAIEFVVAHRNELEDRSADGIAELVRNLITQQAIEKINGEQELEELIGIAERKTGMKSQPVDR